MPKPTLEESIAISSQREQEILEMCRQEFPGFEWDSFGTIFKGRQSKNRTDFMIELRQDSLIETPVSWFCGFYMKRSTDYLAQTTASTPAEALSYCKQRMRAIGEQLISICNEGER